MMSRIRPLLAAGILATAALASRAQTDLQNPVLYKLGLGSTFQRGCFAPCMCPVGISAPVQGILMLTPARSDPLFTYYAVTDVTWKTRLTDGTAIPITGAGTFKIGGEFALTEQLSLDLVVGTDPPQHFDSGLVVPTVPFPLIDLTVSIHGVYCFDTAITLHARPVPKLHADRDVISWDPDPTSSTYDVIRGDLLALTRGGGDFGQATEECVAKNLPAESVPFGTIPPAGGAFWFLVRPSGDSYDSWDTGLAASRDPGIASAPASCP
jgi:hypothetical protein